MEKFFDEFERSIRKAEYDYGNKNFEGIETNLKDHVRCPHCKKLVHYDERFDVACICYSFGHTFVSKEDLL